MATKAVSTSGAKLPDEPEKPAMSTVLANASAAAVNDAVQSYTTMSTAQLIEHTASLTGEAIRRMFQDIVRELRKAAQERIDAANKVKEDIEVFAESMLDIGSGHADRLNGLSTDVKELFVMLEAQKLKFLALMDPPRPTSQTNGADAKDAAQIQQ